MSRKISAFLSSLAIVFLCGCSVGVLGTDELCKNIASNYSCTLNVSDESGNILFGGRLLHSESGYEFELAYPEETAGTVFCVSDGGISAKAGDHTVVLPESAAEKLILPLGVLDEVLLSKNKLSPYRSELYGAECGICDAGGGLLYFSKGVPLLIISNGIRAEITGFSA